MPAVEKKSTGVCRVDDEDLRDEVLVAGAHAGPALAAAPLRPIGRERHPLDVAAVAQRDHHLLALDQVFDIVLELGLAQLRAPRVGELLAGGDQLAAQDRAKALPVLQDVDVVLDLLDDTFELVCDLVALHGGEPLQAQLQDRPCLLVGEPAGARLRHPLAGIGDQRDQGSRILHRPITAGEARAGLGGVLGLANQRDDLVDVGDRDGEAGERVGPRARLPELVGGAPGDDLLAELDETLRRCP